MCKKCINCNSDILFKNTKKYPKDFCSFKCYEQWCKLNKKPNCKCAICGRPLYIKPYRLNRIIHGITCSKECSNILKSKYMMGEKNHQYGIRGDNNSSFKGNEIKKANHKNVDILVYSPEHPFKRSDNRVKKHRLIVEENYTRFDKKYFLNINGKFYLKPEIDVHHINGNHNDNSIDNLCPISRGEHTAIHNLGNEIVRDNLGRIIGIVKSSNIGEQLKLES